jgi:hypothetical protein
VTIHSSFDMQHSRIWMLSTVAPAEQRWRASAVQ